MCVDGGRDSSGSGPGCGRGVVHLRCCLNLQHKWGLEGDQSGRQGRARAAQSRWGAGRRAGSESDGAQAVPAGWPTPGPPPGPRSPDWRAFAPLSMGPMVQDTAKAK